MSEHSAQIVWHRGDQPFRDNRYSRLHQWEFDGGTVVKASASPSVVPLPLSSADAVDPEEAFIASIASCHMLWFLSLAAAEGYCVDEYRDRAQGMLGKNEEGRMAMLQLDLHPQTRFSGSPQPSKDQLMALHSQAHERCFLASSVLTRIRCEPRLLP